MAVNRKLNMQQDQRRAALRNLVTNLLWYGRIETTLARAKETRRIAEKLITLTVREYGNTEKVTKKVAEVDDKGNKQIVKKEVVNDAPSRLAARRRIMQYVYSVPEPRKDGESKYDYSKRAAEVKNPLVEKMFREYGPKYFKRAQDMGTGGGYTRIIKKGPRRGDASEVVILELV
jgi:large subunit ribosomal protein L17